MADTAVTLDSSPWRDTDVHIYTHAAAERFMRVGDLPPTTPVRTVEANSEGTLTTPVAAEEGYVVTGDEGDDNALRWIAQTAGEDGNDITIALVDPEGNDEALAVDVTGDAIEVSLATGPAGAITTTADALKTAIEGDAGADALVAVADEGASDGSGVVEAFAAVPLAYGDATLTTGNYIAAGLDPSGVVRYRQFTVQ